MYIIDNARPRRAARGKSEVTREAPLSSALQLDAKVCNMTALWICTLILSLLLGLE